MHSAEVINGIGALVGALIAGASGVISGLGIIAGSPILFGLGVLGLVFGGGILFLAIVAACIDRLLADHCPHCRERLPGKGGSICPYCRGPLASYRGVAMLPEIAAQHKQRAKIRAQRRQKAIDGFCREIGHAVGTVPGSIDAMLRRIAGEKNDLVYQFLRLLVWGGLIGGALIGAGWLVCTLIPDSLVAGSAG